MKRKEKISPLIHWVDKQYISCGKKPQNILGNLHFDSFQGGEIIIQKPKSDIFVEALLI